MIIALVSRLNQDTGTSTGQLCPVEMCNGITNLLDERPSPQSCLIMLIAAFTSLHATNQTKALLAGQLLSKTKPARRTLGRRPKSVSGGQCLVWTGGEWALENEAQIYSSPSLASLDRRAHFSRRWTGRCLEAASRPIILRAQLRVCVICDSTRSKIPFGLVRPQDLGGDSPSWLPQAGRLLQMVLVNCVVSHQWPRRGTPKLPWTPQRGFPSSWPASDTLTPRPTKPRGEGELWLK